MMFLILGMNVRHRGRLPDKGPAIIIANHNSHLDTMALMTLLPMRLLHKIHPIAAADYFLKNKFIAWFSLKLIGIIPVKRGTHGAKRDLLADVQTCLDNDGIIIMYPEGSRGKPDEIQEFKSGVAHLAQHNPSVPVYPIFLHGLSKALPKDEALLVPFIVDVNVGQAVYWSEDDNYLKSLEAAIQELRSEITGIPANRK
ncbi:MAG: 1-acyl-sn-glycerol-3-phosphate acyltransferase [Gammaproteobacteria bacterium]|nr:1-acyl-sn-glycerol-3-phosphate acyltransferase [Gammaproteobacteria bacterium]